MIGDIALRTRPFTALMDDRKATTAVEFALIAPVLMLLLFGGYQISEAASAYRKITLTAHTVADLTTQYQSMYSSDVSTVLNASAQIMTPFNTSSLVIVLTEFATDNNGNTTVTWSQSLNGIPMTQGSKVTLPPNVAQNNTSIVLSQVTYNFVPAIMYQITGAFVMSSQIFMAPRSVQSITYSQS